MFIEVVKFLEEHKENLAHQAALRMYRELESYRHGTLPIEEAEQNLLQILNFIIANLSWEEEPIEVEQGLFLKNVVKFEEGIAFRRVRFQISLIDMLHSIRMLRNLLWRTLEKEFSSSLTCKQLFKLEDRINKFFISHLISVSSWYLKSQEDIMAAHELDMQKWEELVKSASHIDLKIPCRKEFAVIIRMQAEAIARRLRYSEEAIQDIKLAIGEAGDNAIEHGTSSQGIEIHYHITRDNLCISVIDFGPGFVPNGKGETLPDVYEERGRGIFLMKQFMDKVEIDSAPGRGCRVTLSRKRILK
jgi:anti-sigma regulatory factor (Ser/Thr protein kinase)